MCVFVYVLGACSSLFVVCVFCCCCVLVVFVVSRVLLFGMRCTLVVVCSLFLGGLCSPFRCCCLLIEFRRFELLLFVVCLLWLVDC